MSDSGPTTRKRRLGQLLRQLREDARKRVEDAQNRLRCSQSKISRIENGRVQIKLAELELLLAFYRASDEDRDTALAMWEETQQPGVRLDLDALPLFLRSFVRAEAEASEILALQPILVPGLLQTERYARAVHESGPSADASLVGRRVAVRLARQARITSPDPVRFHAVIDEAAIRRVIGGAVLMHEQLAHLVALARRDNVTLQIAPFGAGAYGTMSGPFTVLRYPDPNDPPAVYVEYSAGGDWVEDRNDVLLFERTFSEAANIALGPTDSVALIKEFVSNLGGEL
ncbi:transcriptional regulator [Longimycelium tulufanense]|uniref:Transcriptional regulator n=1 Tax=Longimycelium tulufanense TaxID=907463 RepID=A0A8J3CCP5_9PSEU|nr:helix-turn-helix transcriptional regulator [Longimycelium tulufanense]GGM46754.1 transcriptional regulator [Longimycelium tulufanense]